MERTFANGDLVQLDVAHLEARARVRATTGPRLHLALERGGYVPWVDDPVSVRLVGDAPDRAVVARIVHSGASTVTLELLRSRDPMDTIPYDERS